MSPLGAALDALRAIPVLRTELDAETVLRGRDLARSGRDPGWSP